MDNSENDILISAYLDDELTVDERAHVERLLASSAEARQLLDDLRALRGGLQELPQHRLEIDFAQQVMHKAVEIGERPSEVGQTSKGADSSSLPSTARSTTPALRKAVQDRGHRPFGRRGIAWSLIAIAAAVVISVTTRSSNENRQVGPVGPPAMVRSPAAGEQPVIGQLKVAVDGDENTLTQNRAVKKELDLSTNGSVAKSEGDAFGSKGIVAESDRRATEERSKSDGLDRPSSNSLAVEERSKSDGLDRPSSNSLAVQDRDALNASADSSSSMMPAPGMGGKLSIQDRGAVGSARVSELTAGATVATNSHDVAAVPQAIVDRFGPEIVVRADMSVDAAQRGAFDQVLAKNSISLPIAQQIAPSNFKRSVGGALRRGGAVSRQNDVDVVYVEAAPEQIQNTLTDLRRSPQVFSSVAVTDLQASANSNDKLALSKDKSALSVQNDSQGERGGGGQDESKLPAAKPEQMSEQPNVNFRLLGRAQRIDLLDEAIQSSASDAKAALRSDGAAAGQIVAGEGVTPQAAGMNNRAEAQSALNKDNSPKQLVQQRAVFLLRIVQPANRAASEPPFPAAAPPMQPSATQAPAAEPAK
jgi:hypothetical protein